MWNEALIDQFVLWGSSGPTSCHQSPSRSAFTGQNDTRSLKGTRRSQNGRPSLKKYDLPPRFWPAGVSSSPSREERCPSVGASRQSSGCTRGLVFQGRLVRGTTVFIPACVRVINDSVHSNGASVYREPPPCIVVIKLLINSLMRLGLTKGKIIVNNAGTTLILSSVTCTELKKKKYSESGMDEAALYPSDDFRHCSEVKAGFVTHPCEIWLRQGAKAQPHSELKELRSRSVELHLYSEAFLFVSHCLFNLCTCVQFSANPDGN